MSDVLKGLLARRADLERRIASDEMHEGHRLSELADTDSLASDLRMQLASVMTQIHVYASAGDTRERGA